MKILREIIIFLTRVFFNMYFLFFGRPTVSTNLQKTISLYKGGGFGEFFSFIRIWDAPFEKINKLVPKEGVVSDLGCGEGVLTNFLAISSSKRKIIGIEIDKERLSQADKNISNVHFQFGDLTKTKIPKSDTIILSHVLHHLPSYEKQEELLIKCLYSLNSRGHLIVVEVNNKPIIKYVISLLTDYFLVAWIFDRKIYERTFFRNTKEWTRLFKKYDLSVKTYKADYSKPFSHMIYYLKKDNFR